MKFPRIAILLSIILFSNCVLSGSNKQEVIREFKIFHSLGYAGKPDLNKYNIEYMQLYGQHSFWGKEKPGELLPSIEKIKKAAEHSINKNRGTVCLDIEHWPVKSSSKDIRAKNIQKYSTVARTFKQYAPKAKIGYYSTLPIRNYWDPVKSKGVDSEKVIVWKSKNSELQKIADSVDIIMPSIYTFYNKPDDWVRYAKAMLTEARKYGKPVYVFVWPEYHPSNWFLAGEYIDEKFWLKQLRTVYKYADGVIIWSKKSPPKKKWDENSGWWKATKTFMHEINYIEPDSI